MNVDVRTTRRVLIAVAALAVAGCGTGGGDAESVGSSYSAESSDVATSDLAGVQIDVRRDPG